jgi:hypothetical protein
MGKKDSASPAMMAIPVLIIGTIVALWATQAPSADLTPQGSASAAPHSGSTTAKPNPKPTTAAPPAKAPAAGDRCATVHDFIRRAGDAIDRNEGAGGYTKMTWDDAGYGIAVGKMQWNQVAGTLPSLLRQWHDADQGRFHAIFGPYANNLLNESYVRHDAIFSPDNDLGHRMLNALAEPVFQRVQQRLEDDEIRWAIGLAKSFGHSSAWFIAEVADIGNQMGHAGVQNALNNADVRNISGEDQAVRALISFSPRPGSSRRNGNIQGSFRAGEIVPDLAGC